MKSPTNTSPADPSSTGAVGPLVDSPSLRTYFENETERRDRTRDMFDAGAAGYDRAESLTGFGSGAWYRRQVLKRLGLRPGMAVLDVAMGTGLVAVEIAKMIQPGGVLVGLDPSSGMLAEAKRKLDIETILGYAESMPIEDARFDVVTMGYALRHVSALDVAMSEYKRVLKPGGQVCLMEIAMPRSAIGRFIVKTHIRTIVPAIARISGERDAVGRLWQYYWNTIQTCVDSEAILEAMRNAGFTQVRCDTTLGIFKEYVGTRPQESAPGSAQAISPEMPHP